MKSEIFRFTPAEQAARVKRAAALRAWGLRDRQIERRLGVGDGWVRKNLGSKKKRKEPPRHCPAI